MSTKKDGRDSPGRQESSPPRNRSASERNALNDLWALALTLPDEKRQVALSFLVVAHRLQTPPKPIRYGSAPDLKERRRRAALPRPEQLLPGHQRFSRAASMSRGGMSVELGSRNSAWLIADRWVGKRVLLKLEIPHLWDHKVGAWMFPVQHAEAIAQHEHAKHHTVLLIPVDR